MNQLRQPVNDIQLNQQRLEVSLQINNILIQKAVEIKRQIDKYPSDPSYTFIPHKYAEDLNQTLKRIQVNLQCIAEISERHDHPSDLQLQEKFIFPQIMVPNPPYPEIAHLYNQLNFLFPGAQAEIHRRMGESRTRPQYNQHPQQTISPSHRQSSLLQTPSIPYQQPQLHPLSQQHTPQNLYKQPSEVQQQMYLMQQPQLQQQQQQQQHHQDCIPSRPPPGQPNHQYFIPPQHQQQQKSFPPYSPHRPPPVQPEFAPYGPDGKLLQ